MEQEKAKVLYLYEQKYNEQFVKRLQEQHFDVIVKKFVSELLVYKNTYVIVADLPTKQELLKEQFCKMKNLLKNTLFIYIAEEFDPLFLQQSSLLLQTLPMQPSFIQTSQKKIVEFICTHKNSIEYKELLKEYSLKMEGLKDLKAVVHQWKQPLNLISMESINLELLANLQSKLASADVLKSTQMIATQVQRMSNILKIILDMGKKKRVKELFSLNSFLDTLSSSFEESLKENNIDLHVKKLEEDEEFYGFATDLQEVLVNLISNARDAYIEQKEKEKSSIFLEVRKDEHFVYIDVKDSAGGIPKELQEKIFELHFSTKHERGGSGIGLHLARVIVEQEFDGTLTLLSDTQGSQFTIKLPKIDQELVRLIR